MSLNPFQGSAKSSTGGDDYEIPSEDSHPACLVAIIDLGTHTQQFQGAFSDKREVAFVWQLAEEQTSGEPFFIAGRFTLSYHEKAGLRKALEAQRRKKYTEGESVDLTSFAGSPWMLPITHEKKIKDGKERVYAKLGAPSALPKGMTAPKPVIKPFCWFIGCGKPVPADAWLPRVYGQKIPDLINLSKELLGEKAEAGVASNGSIEEQTPF